MTPLVGPSENERAINSCSFQGQLNSISRIENKNGDLDPATGEFVEEILIECLIGFFGTHGEIDIAADELVWNLTVSGQTFKL